MSEAIGEEGWRILAKAIRPGVLRGIFVSRDDLAQGKREDIKHLFDAVYYYFRIYKTLEDLQAGNLAASLFVDQENNNWSPITLLPASLKKCRLGGVEVLSFE